MKPVGNLNEWNKAMTDKEVGKKIIDYSKKSHNDEILKFLSLMKAGKKDASTYNLYIKKGSKYEINISGKLHEQFDKAFAADIAKGPWDTATQEVLKMFNDNIMTAIK